MDNQTDQRSSGLSPGLDPILEIYKEAAGGHQEPLDFLLVWHNYCHQIDDLVDGDLPATPENLFSLLMLANSLYSMPFYLRFAGPLSAVVAQVTNTYADSVAWEKASEDWKQRVADVIRLAGNEMVLAVANLVGGFQHMRKISLRLREAAWHSQH